MVLTRKPPRQAMPLPAAHGARCACHQNVGRTIRQLNDSSDPPTREHRTTRHRFMSASVASWHPDVLDKLGEKAECQRSRATASNYSTCQERLAIRIVANRLLSEALLAPPAACGLKLQEYRPSIPMLQQ